ncbi:MAG: metalloregulator ArsR/SmtB family transcription factor [Planctomycetota bacterium]|nr:metalloregulator ArsR/SmtB family transcription factor [Planctomycetota bacterium]
MEASAAIKALGALAHDSRLAVFRDLARMAPEGLAAGALAERVQLPPSTLSFHLQHLVNAGLVHVERRGRMLLYSLRPESLRELFWFLGEDCCQGRLELCTSVTGRIAERLEEASQMERPTVLFLCTHNSARSQMAEALLRLRAGDRFEVYSGGLKPRGIHPLTLEVLQEIGVDTGELQCKDLGQLLGKVAIHHAIIVCESANSDCPRLHPFARHQHYWPFPDPVDEPGDRETQLALFRQVRDAIDARIQTWLAHDSIGLSKA